MIKPLLGARLLVAATLGFASSALSTDGGTLYLSLSREDRVAAIDLATFEIVRYYGTGAGPDGVGVSPVVVSR